MYTKRPVNKCKWSPHFSKIAVWARIRVTRVTHAEAAVATLVVLYCHALKKVLARGKSKIHNKRVLCLSSFENAHNLIRKGVTRRGVERIACSSRCRERDLPVLCDASSAALTPVIHFLPPMEISVASPSTLHTLLVTLFPQVRLVLLHEDRRFHFPRISHKAIMSHYHSSMYY